MITPSLFINLDDGSGLLQLVSNYDLRQDLRVLAGFNLPFGPGDTEFGGIPVGSDGVLLAPGTNVFAKLALFF